jgi:diadenosine tetraphosphate (Ap4A) HIT family hydrolase
MAEDCLVCKEHRLEVPPPGGHLVATDEVVAFHLPLWPPATPDVYLGYLMVTPRRHAAGFADLDDDEAAGVGRAMALLSRALKAAGAERVYTFTIGHAVPHLHVHLVPRWPGTPPDVSWLEVAEWDGARRGDFDAATAFAESLRELI